MMVMTKRDIGKKRSGIPNEMDIKVVYSKSYHGENLLSRIYDNLGVKLTGALNSCDGYSRSKEKARTFRKKTHTKASKLGERIFVDTTGPYPDILIGNRYCIGVVNNYSLYSCSLFMKTKL